MSRTVRTTLAVVAATVTTAAGAVAGSAPAAVSAPRATGAAPSLHAIINKHKFVLKGSRHLQATRVNLTLTAKGGDREVEIVKFKTGYTFKDLVTDIKAFGASFGPNGASKSGLKHLRRAVHHTTLYGGLDAGAKHAGHGTVVLDAGTYTVFDDSGNYPRHPKTLRVSGPSVTVPPQSSATVTAAGDDRFGGDKTLPAKGTIGFDNHADQPHFLILQHVKSGTTRKQVHKYFAAGGQGEPSWALRESAATDTISPGLGQTLTYSLPKGEYVELCFFPDLQTGMPHANMGMYRLVHLK